VEDVVVSVVSSTRVEIGWTAPPGGRNSGYNVEPAVVEVWSDDQLVRLKRRTEPLATPVVGAIRRIGPFKRLTMNAVAETSFVDTDIDLSKPKAIDGEPSFDRPLHAEHLDESARAYPLGVLAYRIRTIDEAGNESGPSPAILTIPSSPQHVFSRENGTTCQLKWAANPEKGIAGYRVYRMDGRFDKEPVSRLTGEPWAATTYEDATAGKASRRHYVIAVDALGQEGFPSSPVWFQREWRDYYVPFITDWHQ
jgi:hypothetical protein